jgi:hypothetical protein
MDETPRLHGATVQEYGMCCAEHLGNQAKLYGIQSSTAQHSTVQYNTVQHSTACEYVQTERRSKAQAQTIPHRSSLQYCIITPAVVSSAPYSAKAGGSSRASRLDLDVGCRCRSRRHQPRAFTDRCTAPYATLCVLGAEFDIDTSPGQSK